jgi:hypothetical protein
MPKVKIYFFKDHKNIPYIDQQDILVFGQPKLSFIEKYYECVYEINEKRKILNITSYLRYIAQKFTFKESPLKTEEKIKYLESIKSHDTISIGDIIQVDDNYYAISYGKCELIKD